MRQLSPKSEPVVSVPIRDSHRTDSHVASYVGGYVLADVNQMR